MVNYGTTFTYAYNLAGRHGVVCVASRSMIISGVYMNLPRMIRKDGYKQLVYPKIDKVLLFDMKNDPNEMKDLANNSKYTEKVASLFKDLMELQKTMNDSLDLKDTYKKVVKLP